MPEDLQIIAPRREQHFDAILDLTAKCFSYSGYWGWTARAPKYFDDCIYDWQASRIGLVGGQVVTHFGVWDHQVRIGRGRVRVAGIGAVATHGEFRKRGLVLETARDCLAGLAPAGYDLTALSGIPKFYHKLGYVQGWPAENWSAQVDDLPAATTPVALRKFRPAHREELARLYNRQNAEMTGTAVRPTFLQCRNPWEGYLWRDGRGAVAGYVIVGETPEKLQHFDSAGDAADVLDALRRIAHRKRHKTVELIALHRRSELARALRRCDCRAESHYQASGGAMVRTVNLRSTLAKITDELARRLAKSPLAKWRGELLISDPREKVVLRVDRGEVALADQAVGRVEHAIRGGEEIARLLLGSAEPAEVAEPGGIRTRGAGRELLEALFPPQQPMLSRWDYY